MKTNLVLLIIIVFVIIVAFSLLRIPVKEKYNCESFVRMKEKEFYGCVVKKFRDVGNHNLPTIKIQSQKGEIDQISLLRDISGLYDYLDINDTVKKEKGSESVYVRSISKIDTTFILDYACND